MTFLSAGLGIGQHVSETVSSKKWLEWDETHDFKKPTLLIIGGTPACCSRAANGMAKIAETVSGFFTTSHKPVQIVSTYFTSDYYIEPDEDNKSRVRDVEYKDARDYYMWKKGCLGSEFATPHLADYFKRHAVPLENPRCLTALYKNFFQPLISEMRDDQPVRLTLDTAKKNTRNLNIIAHSAGCATAMILGEMMATDMYNLGYAAGEIKTIQNQISLLTNGITTPVGYAKFKTLHLMSRGDITLDQRQTENTWNHQFATGFSKDRDTSLYLSFSPSESVFLVDKINKTTTRPDKTTEHGETAYFDPNEKSKTANGKWMCALGSYFVQAAVSNSIQNAHSNTFKELGSVDDMLAEKYVPYSDQQVSTQSAPPFDLIPTATRNGQAEKTRHTASPFPSAHNGR